MGRYGIDTAAHGESFVGGKTVAVLKRPDKIYPHENQNLAEEILNMRLCAEYEAAHVFKQNFIQRNRIISGLSLAVIVGSPERSGPRYSRRETR